MIHIETHWASVLICRNKITIVYSTGLLWKLYEVMYVKLLYKLSSTKEICKFLISKNERCGGCCDTLPSSPLQDWGTASSAAGGIGNCQLSAENHSRTCRWVKKAALPKVKHYRPNLHPVTGWWADTEVEPTSFHLGQPEGPSWAQSPRKINWGRPLCGCIEAQSLAASSLPPLQPHRHHSQEYPYTKISEFQGAQPVSNRIIWFYMSLLIATSILSGFPW